MCCLIKYICKSKGVSVIAIILFPILVALVYQYSVQYGIYQLCSQFPLVVVEYIPICNSRPQPDSRKASKISQEMKISRAAFSQSIIYLSQSVMIDLSVLNRKLPLAEIFQSDVGSSTDLILFSNRIIDKIQHTLTRAISRINEVFRNTSDLQAQFERRLLFLQQNNEFTTIHCNSELTYGHSLSSQAEQENVLAQLDYTLDYLLQHLLDISHQKSWEFWNRVSIFPAGYEIERLRMTGEKLQSLLDYIRQYTSWETEYTSYRSRKMVSILEEFRYVCANLSTDQDRSFLKFRLENLIEQLRYFNTKTFLRI